MLFEGFQIEELPTPRGIVHARVGVGGPPLLLLHGYPETHLMWHTVAPLLAARFSLVMPDLPGYGDSFLPVVSEDHSSHGKRAMAADLIAAMSALGHDKFAVAGHDRGGRVGYRMALDHPEMVTKLAVMDIVPTATVWARADAQFALIDWFFAFLAQPAPLPEALILGNPDGFWLMAERLGLKGDRENDAVAAAYRAQLAEPDRVVAICEDFRAGAGVDREMDEADIGSRAIGCPVRVFWAGLGALPRFYEDPLELWTPYAPQATGRQIDGATHFFVEDKPTEVAADLTEFFAY
jgi:haloacetate dehalogenase